MSFFTFTTLWPVVVDTFLALIALFARHSTRLAAILTELPWGKRLFPLLCDIIVPFRTPPFSPTGLLALLSSSHSNLILNMKPTP